MLDHKKEAITEHWQFCPKCNLKLCLLIHI